MSKVIVDLANGETIVFDENTIGHQIGNGAVQILMEDGGQVVYNNFTRVEVEPSEEEKKQFLESQAKAEEMALMQEKERERNLEAMRQAESLKEPANDETAGDTAH